MTGRHAYLIQAHGQFGLLAKLLTALDDPRNDIYLHIDARKTFPEGELKQAVRSSKLEFTPRIPVHWGGPSQIWSELILLKEALKGGEYDYFHLLSGCDLPIKSQNRIHAFFEENHGKEFVAFWQLKPPTPARFRFVPFPEHGKNFAGNMANNIFKGIHRLFPRNPHPEIEYCYGPNWFSITREFATYLVENESLIRKLFSHNCNCDEVFAQTLLKTSPYYVNCYSPQATPAGNSAMANVRFIDWTRGESVRHPWIFTEEDYDLLKSRPEFFARKFREGSQIVDDIIASLK